MHFHCSRWLLPAGLALFVITSHAQSESVGQRPDPADSRASVPAVQYRSAFDGYRPLGDESIASWKNANEQVGRNGGWRAYAREAAQPDAAKPTPARPDAPSSAPASATDGEGGMGGHSMRHGGHK